MLLIIECDRVAARTVARNLRANKIWCKIVPNQISKEQVELFDPSGIIFAGAETPPSVLPSASLLELNLPTLVLGVLSIWYIQQLNGGAITYSNQPTLADVTFDNSLLYKGFQPSKYMLCGEYNLVLPEVLKAIAFDEKTNAIVAFKHTQSCAYATTMLVEKHDPYMDEMLFGFANGIANCTPWWSEDAFIEKTVAHIKRAVGEENAMCAMTGGLNSGVAALLASLALGDNLKCIFVNTGLFRSDEVDLFLKYYQQHKGLNIKVINAQEQFLHILEGVVSSEDKHREIHNLLKAIVEKEQREIPSCSVVIRGTSFKDSMNIGFLNEYSNERHLAPLCDLFKEEIRQVGRKLGIWDEIVEKQPLAATALAQRIVGSVTREKLEILKRADDIFASLVRDNGSTKKLWQFFAILADYEQSGSYMVCLRAVQLQDGNYAYPARLPYDLLEKAVEQIQEDERVARVVYDITPAKNLVHIEW